MLVSEQSYYIGARFQFSFGPANTLAKQILPYTEVYLVKVFVKATAFQFTFIVQYYPFTPTFGTQSLSSIIIRR